jgi:hypothetical protein
MSRDDATKHILLLDEKGQLHDPGGDHAPLTQQRRAAYISNMLAEIRGQLTSGKKKRLLIFVHGGMNSWGDVLGRYDEAWQHSFTNSDAYPLMVVWPSSISATYLEHLTRIRQGEEVSETVGYLTSPFIFVADLGRAVTRAPLVWGKMVVNDYEASYLGDRWAGETKRDEAKQHYCKLVNDGVSISINNDYRNRREMYSRFGAYAVTFPGKILLSPFVDALGKSGWDNMLRRTENIFPHQLGSSQQTNVTVQGRFKKSRVLDSRAALPLFFYELSRDAAANHYTIDLVGHSMGAIILNRVIKDSPIEFSNIVYLAAACTVQDFHLYLGEYLEAHRPTQFYCLTLHPVGDTREMYQTFLDLPPRGSLLVWIDNFLSSPLNGSGRTLGRWENLFKRDYQNRHLIDDMLQASYGANLHFKAFNIATNDSESGARLRWYCSEQAHFPRLSGPQCHGDFTGEKFWEPSFWQPQPPGVGRLATP